jgi:hypothetical protein
VGQPMPLSRGKATPVLAITSDCPAGSDRVLAAMSVVRSGYAEMGSLPHSRTPTGA